MRALVVVALAFAGVVPLAIAPRLVPRAPVTSNPEGPAPKVSAPALVCSTSQIAINPCTTAATVFTRRTRTTTFTVQNKNTIENMNYIITCGKSGRVISCSAPGTLYVPKNSSKNVVLTWVTDTLAGSGTATLTADDDLTPVTGTVNVTVTAPAATPMYVAVASPHLQTQRVDSGAAGTAKFVLRNGGADSTGWSWLVTCSGSAIVGGSCSPTSGSVGLAANASSTVSVGYTSTGGNTATGTIRLTMTRTANDSIRDSALVEIAIARRDSLLIVSDVNPGTSLEPKQCVTASVGEGLAMECGAVRAAHALPGVRTLGVNRSPVLLYNSAQAHPFATVRADLTLPDTRVPDSVVVVLKDSTGAAISGARGAWPGSQWRARSTRRVAVTVDALSWPSGIHRYTLEGRRWYGGSLETLSVTGSLWIVNRSASPYGAGWWVAGVEAILNPDGDLRWTGGDGATRRYVNQGGNVWVAPALDRPDTIVLVGTSYFERRLPRGLRVRFDYSSGRHIQTVNRLGHVTRFVYQGGTTRLDSIIVPSGSLVRAYTFQYDGSGLLRAVQAPRLVATTARRDSLVVDGSAQVTTVLQRDGSAIRFLYQDATTLRMTGRVNERGDTTRVALSTPGTITTVSLPVSVGVRDTLYTAAGEVRGLAGGNAVPLGDAYTLIFGPRRSIGDSTQFWIDRWGAPTVVRNAVGDETQLARADARFPALVTRLRAPNGQVLGATYTNRGRVTTLADSATVVGGVVSTTTYRWDASWDVVTYARGPGGDSVNMAYDGSNGNMLWRQDGRGSSTRTSLTYVTSGVAAGLVARSTTATGVTDSLRYDALLGNVDRQVSPYGGYAALTQDSLGRITQTARPFDATANEVIETNTFDVLDRAIQVLTRGGADSVLVRKVFGASGNLDSLTRQSLPDAAGMGMMRNAYTYDGRRRMLSDWLVGSFGTFYFYDAAGNLTSGGRQPAVREYDALNRMTRKMGSDTSRYVYDEVGALRSAFNPVARVTRRYARNGTLLTDSLRIATRRLTERVFDQNIFGIGARYDIAKRRVAMPHPAATDSERVAFSAITGYVDSVTSASGNRFRFEYDGDARISRLIKRSGLADSVTEVSQYDSLARRVRRIQRAGTDSLLSDTVRYTRADKARGALGDSAGYAALGALKAAFTSASGNNELYQVDGLGHRWYSQMSQNLQGPSTTTYEANSERVARVVTGSLDLAISAESTFMTYAYSGAVSQDVRRKWYGPAKGYKQTKLIVNEYDPERRMISSYFRLDSIPAPRLPYVGYNRMERYRYDPLGRRVWREMIRDTLNLICQAQNKSSGCRNEVTRTVWDGDQVLVDIRALADTVGDSSEGIPSAGTFVGRTDYTHAGGIDTPLEIVAPTGVILPIADWRGQYAAGTCPGTKCDPNATYFPGAQGSAFEEPVPFPNGPPRWIGELVTGMADGSGYQYKRSRYYNSSSGQFTQEDPLGLSGGANTYGIGGGDPINFADPMGTDVVFKGDAAAAERVFNELLAAARSAKASEDKQVAEAGSKLESMLSGMVNDHTTIYTISVTHWGQERLDESGGGMEVCVRNSCFINMASNLGYPSAGALTTLAHESGGAFGSRRGVDHYSAEGGVKWENLARTMFSCVLRQDHNTAPTQCR